MRLQAITHAAGRCAEARLLVLDWTDEGDHVSSQLKAAVGALDAALHILSAAMVAEKREEGG